MAIAKIAAKTISHVNSPSLSNFKSVMSHAKNSKPQSLSLVNAIDNHHKAIKTVEKFLNHDEYSPSKLLKVQYKTGILFLREQMFCKTVELSANTIKNFIQMPL